MKFEMKFAALPQCLLLVFAFFTCTPVMSAESIQIPTSDQVTATVKQTKPKRPVRKRRVRKQQVQSSQSDQYSTAFIGGLSAASSCGLTDDPTSCLQFQQVQSFLVNGCGQGNKNACSYAVKLQQHLNDSRLIRNIRAY